MNINKPSGMTSHDIVASIRGTFHEKKVGHTGTLDPDATGVLPLCIGKATKIARHISNTYKIYSGCMKIGARTDTQDSTGKVIYEGSISGITGKDIKNTFLEFTGEIEQIPPMYSAVKYKGKRLYKLARQGITIKRKPKQVTIYYTHLIKFTGDMVMFEVKTSPGTYVRTLCDQVGEKLGCGAHLHSLTRLSVGPFNINYSISLIEAEDRFKNGTIADVIYPVERVSLMLAAMERASGIES